MAIKRTFSDEQLRYLNMLSKQYPTLQSASAQIIRLAQIKKAYFPENGWFSAACDDERHAVCARFGSAETELAGLFSLKGKPVEMQTDLPDGSYTDLIAGTEICVQEGRVKTGGRPLIFKIR